MLVAGALSNLGRTYRYLGEMEKALKYYQKSTINFELSEHKFGTANSAYNIGSIYLELDSFNRSKEYHQKALVIFQELGNLEGVSDCYLSLAAMVRKQGKYAEAEKRLNEGMKILDQVDSKDPLVHYYKEFYKLYSDMGDYQMAYEYHIKYSTLEDTFLNKEGNKKIDEMQIKYETDKKVKEIEVLKEKEKARNLEWKRKRIQNIIFINFSIVIFLLAIILYNFSRLKKRANLLLTEKNSELETLNTTKDKFFNIVSHDLRNYFVSFLSISDLLTSQFHIISEKKKHHLIQRINKSANTLYIIKVLLKIFVNRPNN